MRPADLLSFSDNESLTDLFFGCPNLDRAVTVRRLLLNRPVAVAAVIVAVVLAVAQGADDPKPQPLQPRLDRSGRLRPGPNGKVFGTTETPQQVAAEAVENQVDAQRHGRARPAPAAGERLQRARRRVPPLRRRPGAAPWARPPRRCSAPSTAATAPRPAPPSTRRSIGGCCVGAAYGALGDLDGSISGSLDALETGLWSGRAVKSLHAPAAELRRRRPPAAAAVRKSELDPLDLRDPRARDPRGHPARPAGRPAGVRATADAVVGDQDGHRTRCAACCRAAATCSQQVDGNLRTLSGTLDQIKAPVRRVAGARAAAARADHERFVGRLGADAGGALRRARRRSRPAIPSRIPKLPEGGKK